MISPTSILNPGIQDIRDAIDDFVRAGYQAATSSLARLVSIFDEEPMAGFLGNSLPEVDFDAWLGKTTATPGGMQGSGYVELPAPRAERVAIQIALCRRMAGRQINFLDFVHEYYYCGRHLPDHVDEFAERFLEPMLRDIERMKETRTIAPVLISAMGALPSTQDSTLDSLLEEAMRCFKDNAPETRTRAVERLWDGWERLKSLNDPKNKKVSISALLDSVSNDKAVRGLIDVEAATLTKIGNQFHIRHFEADRDPVAAPEILDYLFHRLFSFIQLLLFSKEN